MKLHHFMAPLAAAALCICACSLTGCERAEAEQDERWRYESVAYVPWSMDRTYVLTDSETGRQWIVVSGGHGVAIAPAGGDDGR